MDKVIPMPQIEEDAIEIKKTPEFLASAKKISDFIKDLPISHAKNDEVISLLFELVNISKHDAFMQGFDMGLKMSKKAE